MCYEITNLLSFCQIVSLTVSGRGWVSIAHAIQSQFSFCLFNFANCLSKGFPDNLFILIPSTSLPSSFFSYFLLLISSFHFLLAVDQCIGPMAGILFQEPISNRKEVHSAGIWDLCNNAQLRAGVGIDIGHFCKKGPYNSLKLLVLFLHSFV